MNAARRTAHEDLHAEHGAYRGERADRSRNPLVKVEDLAWLEFEKPDLDRAERFFLDFGFTISARTATEVHLRGTLPGSQCLVVRQGVRSRFVAPVFRAASRSDLDTLARVHDTTVDHLVGPGGGHVVDLHDPSGSLVRVVHGVEQLTILPAQTPLTFNLGTERTRVNQPQRPPREPARVLRLGHVVLESTRFSATLDWYLDNLGLIASDFLFFPGQRERGPTMAFMRCDRGMTPSDHHTVAMTMGMTNGYVHSAYQVADLDAVAAGGAFLEDRGYHRAWGIGRHVQGSQIFDYWRDPERIMVEHFADGDLFDRTVDAGWAPMTASGLSQWGPPVTRDFLGATPSPDLVKNLLTALRADDNEFDVRSLLGLLKVARS